MKNSTKLSAVLVAVLFTSCTSAVSNSWIAYQMSSSGAAANHSVEFDDSLKAPTTRNSSEIVTDALFTDEVSEVPIQTVEQSKSVPEPSMLLGLGVIAIAAGITKRCKKA